MSLTTTAINISIFVYFFQIALIWVLIFKQKFHKPTNDSRFAPKLDIVVPVFNNEKNIIPCLKAITKSHYPNHKLNIIVANDGSTDATSKLVREFALKHQKITLLNLPHQGKSLALNSALNHCQSDFVITIDSDCEIFPDFLSKIIQPFKDPKIGACFGLRFIKNPSNPLEHFQDVEFTMYNTIKSVLSTAFKYSYWDDGAAGCYRKTTITNNGAFSRDTFSEEVDLTLNMCSVGYQTLNVVGAHFLTTPCSTFQSWYKQRMRWAYGSLQCTLKHIHLFGKKSFGIDYFLFNQLFWLILTPLFLPLTLISLSKTISIPPLYIGPYLAGFFTQVGPLVLLLKTSLYGIKFPFVFAALAANLNLLLIIFSQYHYKQTIFSAKFFAIYFYPAYGFLMSFVTTSSLIYYRFKKRRYFIA